MCPFSLKLSTTSSWSQISFSHLFKRCIHTYPITNDLSVMLMVCILGCWASVIHTSVVIPRKYKIKKIWFVSAGVKPSKCSWAFTENYIFLKLKILRTWVFAKLLCKENNVIFKCVSIEIGSHFSYKAGFAWMLFKQLTFLSVFCCLFL